MMNTPSMYSVDQLLKARQNGVPDYVVVPMLQKAMAQKQAMAQQQALQQGMNPPPPVADQILDAAHNDVMQEHMARRSREEMTPVPSSRKESRGIDVLPSGIDESDYAHGGIIAFARGGSSATDAAGGDAPEAEDDYLELISPNADALRESNATAGYSVRDPKTGEMTNKHWKSMKDSLVAEHNLVSKHNGEPLDQFYRTYYGHDKPKDKQDEYVKQLTEFTGLSPDTVINKDDPKLVKRVTGGLARKEQGYENLDEAAQDAILSGKPYRVKSRDGQAPSKQSTQQGITSLPEARNSIASLAYPSAPEEQQQPYTQEETTPEYEGKRLQEYLGENPNAAKREARLSKREADLSEEKDRSPWLALMQAGLATMAGTSPNAFANIGAGASEGLKAYAEARKDLSKSSDKLMDLRGEIEDAQYAHEQAIKTHGWDSAQANKKANLLVAKENQKAKYEHKKDAAEYELKKFEAENKGNVQNATAELYRQKPEMEANKLAGKGALTPADRAKIENGIHDDAITEALKLHADFANMSSRQQSEILNPIKERLRADRLGSTGTSAGAPVQQTAGVENWTINNPNYWKH